MAKSCGCRRPGIVSEDENFELIEGEIVPMQAKTHAHELLKSALTIGVARALPEHLWMGVESSIYLSPDTFVEPDIVVYPRGLMLEDAKGSDILLAIEVAATISPTTAAQGGALCAPRVSRALGGRRRGARDFRPYGPARDGWRSIVERGPDEALIVEALPGFSLRLGTVERFPTRRPQNSCRAPARG